LQNIYVDKHRRLHISFHINCAGTVSTVGTYNDLTNPKKLVLGAKWSFLVLTALLRELSAVTGSFDDARKALRLTQPDCYSSLFSD
jgi:hypothetical protein